MQILLQSVKIHLHLNKCNYDAKASDLKYKLCLTLGFLVPPKRAKQTTLSHVINVTREITVDLHQDESNCYTTFPIMSLLTSERNALASQQLLGQI